MNGSGDPASSPVTAAIAQRLLGDAPNASAPIVVEYHYDPRVSVEVERNSKGYRWHIDVAANDARLVQELVDHLDTWLGARFGDAG